MPSRRSLILLIILIVAVASVTLYDYYSSLSALRLAAVPLSLVPGDSWSYDVVFPDSKGYTLTETVQEITEINGTSVYLILRTDNLHMSTEYAFISQDWHEVESYKPYVGNIEANVTTIYSPPLELFKIPFQVGDNWTVNGTVRTLTGTNGNVASTTQPLAQERRTTAIEAKSTPAGQFETYQVTVTSINNSLLEKQWFSTEIGHIVYGEYYNGEEKVTETLIDYRLTARSSASDLSSFANPVPLIFDGNLSQAICTSELPLSTAELKRSFE